MGREPSQLLAVALTTHAAVTKVSAVGKRASVAFCDQVTKVTHDIITGKRLRVVWWGESTHLSVNVDTHMT